MGSEVREVLEALIKKVENSEVFSGCKPDKDLDDEDVEEIIFLEDVPETNLAELKAGRSSFDDLPEELALKIFSFLTFRELCKHVAPVCKQWLCYSKCPLLRQSLSLLETYSWITSLEELGEIIRSNFPLLKHLYLQPRTELTLHGCVILAQSCPLLQSLSLSFCDQVTKDTLDQFATFCSYLRDINLEGCAVTDKCLECLECLPLKRLNTSHCTQLTDYGLKFLSTRCHQLCSLNFDGIQWITHDAIAVLVKNCQDRLEHLWLDGESMTDDTVQLITKCRRLKFFGLSFCESLTDQSLLYVQNMVNLVSLRLKKGSEFSGEALKELFVQLHPERTGNPTGLLHITVAECTNLNDAALHALAESCRYLESLDISWCWEVTDSGLDHVVKNCHRMVDMNICGAKDLRGNPLKKIPQNMPMLRQLDATQCNLVPDEMLEELVFLMPWLTVTNYYGEDVKPPKHKNRMQYFPQEGWCQFALQTNDVRDT